MARPSPLRPDPQTDTRLRPMDPDDLAYVVSTHLHHFPHGFFARLGARYLRAYYRAFLSAVDARAYVVEDAGVPAGFLVGVTDPARHRRHVLRVHGHVLAFRAAVALLARPRLAVHFVRTRLRRYLRRLADGARGGRAGGPAARTSAADAPVRVAVLTHVAVEAWAQGRGLGSALVGQFLDDAAEVGCTRVTLVTEVGPGGASPYWASRGWQAEEETRTPEGRRLVVYARPVSPMAYR